MFEDNVTSILTLIEFPATVLLELFFCSKHNKATLLVHICGMGVLISSGREYAMEVVHDAGWINWREMESPSMGLVT